MTKRLGDVGERQAIAFLRGRGYLILAHNFRTRFGEVDIVAQDENEVVFVEVKTRTNTHFGAPEEAVNRAKLDKITKVASEFMTMQGLTDVQSRFEVIAIVDGKTLRLISEIYIDNPVF